MHVAVLTVMTAARAAALGGLARLVTGAGPARPVSRVRPGRRRGLVFPPRWGGAAGRGRQARRERLARAERLRSGERASGQAATDAGWRRAQALRAMPRQIVPASEAVDLTPAERAAFAGLVRQFGQGHG